MSSTADSVTISKRCYACGEVKPFRDFCNRTAAHDGKQSHCRDCGNKRDRNGNGSRASAEHVAESICPECCNLTDRRPRFGLCRCGLRWEAEPKPQLEEFLYQSVDARGLY